MGGRVLAVARVAAAGAVVAGGVVSAVAGDGETPPTGDEGCVDRPVLSSLTGVFSSASGDFSLEGTAVDFGPAWYLAETSSLDLDGDGQVSTLADELAGLDGRVLTLEVDEAGRGGDRDAYSIDGSTYRSAEGCPPEWAGGPGGGGPPGLARIPSSPGTADEADRPEGELPSAEGAAARARALAFVDEVRTWTMCVAEAAPSSAPDQSFDPEVACGPFPTAPDPTERAAEERADTDPPESAGPPEGAGPTDSASLPESAGPVDDAGPPDPAGPPGTSAPLEAAGLPETAGPPTGSGQ